MPFPSELIPVSRAPAFSKQYGQINQPHGYLEKANLVLFLFASLVIFCVHMCMWYCKQRKLQYSCLTVNFTFGGKFPVCGSKWLPGHWHCIGCICLTFLQRAFSNETFPVCGSKWLPGLARCWCWWMVTLQQWLHLFDFSPLKHFPYVVQRQSDCRGWLLAAGAGDVRVGCVGDGTALGLVV